MEDYIAKVNQDEVSYICELIPAKSFRKLFQKHSSEFTKIKRGFRPNALSDVDTIDLVKNNTDKAFIHEFINKKINTWLKQISQCKEKYIDEGYSAEKALLLTLKDSVFSERINVYMRLSDTEKSQEYIELLQASIDELNTVPVSETSSKDDESSFKTEKTESENIKEEKEEWEKEKDSLIKQNSTLRDELAADERDIAKLNGDNESLKYSEEKLREENEDLNKRTHKAHSVDLSHSEDFPYRSLCIVFTGGDGRIRLNRISDVEGNIILDLLKEDYPEVANLYAPNNETYINDYMGIWDWNVEPQINDPTKPFYTSILNNKCTPIEIVFLKNCDTAKDIINSLIAGIEKALFSERIMYACWDNSSKMYIGVLCKRGELIDKGGSIKINDSVVSLPMYFFSSDELFQIKDRYVFNQLDIGIPDQVIYVKNEFDIVKEKVLSRAKWAAMKQKGLTRNETKEIRDFLAELPADEICTEVSKDLDCSIEKSQDLFSNFVDHANEYLNGQNIEDVVLEQVVRNDPELMNHCKTLISEDWKEENATIISEAEANRNEIHEQITAEEQRVQELNEEYLSKKDQYDKLLIDINQEETLALDVEEKVKERIKNAQKDAADFIASQAFTSSNVITKEEKPDAWERGKTSSEELEELDEWESTVDLIADNLREAGISPEYAIYFAIYLYAAYEQNMPVLLIGPNGRAIADAFAMAISGQTSAILHCEGNCCFGVFQELEEISESVIAIENIFEPQWHNQVIEYAQSSNKFLIAITPYAEDMQIEPQGILNYWLPVMTELFVVSKPSSNYIGGKLSDNYIKYSGANYSTSDEKFMQTLSLSEMGGSRLQQILSDMSEMSGEQNNTSTLTLFFWLPYAYILDKLDDLNDYLNENTIDKRAMSLVSRYIGDSE